MSSLFLVAPAKMLIADQREARRCSFAESYISIDFLMPRKTHARPFSTAGRSRKLRSNPSAEGKRSGAFLSSPIAESPRFHPHSCWSYLLRCQLVSSIATGAAISEPN